jgi:sugar/nucleoside kinase (ribokinase family)
MARHYDVITVGETTLDAFMTLEEESHSYRYDNEHGELCFKHGDKIDVKRYDFCMGGNATNVAVGLSRLGIHATLCTEIGDDEFSIKIRNMLAREHIDRIYIKQGMNMASNFSVIMNIKNDRTLFVEDVEREHAFDFQDMEAAYYYLTSLGRKWQEAYRKVTSLAKEQNAKLVFNPGSRQMHEGRETILQVIKHTDILIVNKEEAECLLFEKEKEDSPNEHDYIKELLKKLQEAGAKGVIITNGQHGSFALEETGDYHHQGLYPGEIVERTGAGDAYSSGFLGALLHSKPFEDAMLWGSINSASVVGHIGAEAGLLKKEEIEKRVEVERS